MGHPKLGVVYAVAGQWGQAGSEQQAESDLKLLSGGRGVHAHEQQRGLWLSERMWKVVHLLGSQTLDTHWPHRLCMQSHLGQRTDVSDVVDNPC